MCGFTFVTHGELRLVDHPRQARRMPTFLTPACGLVRGRRGVGSLFPPRGRELHPHVKQFRHFCVRHILASICITYVSRQLVAPKSHVGLVLRRVTELVAEFSPSAYTTDTQPSRVKRIPDHMIGPADDPRWTNAFTVSRDGVEALPLHRVECGIFFVMAHLAPRTGIPYAPRRVGRALEVSPPVCHVAASCAICIMV